MGEADGKTAEKIDQVVGEVKRDGRTGEKGRDGPRGWRAGDRGGSGHVGWLGASKHRTTLAALSPSSAFGLAARSLPREARLPTTASPRQKPAKSKAWAETICVSSSRDSSLRSATEGNLTLSEKGRKRGRRERLRREFMRPGWVWWVEL